MKAFIETFGKKYKLTCPFGVAYVEKIPAKGDVILFNNLRSGPSERQINELFDFEGNNVFKWRDETKNFLGN